jgi:hypothetical protein
MSRSIATSLADRALAARLRAQATEDARRRCRVEGLASWPALLVAVKALEDRAGRMPASVAKTWILRACGSVTRPRWIGGLTALRDDLAQAQRVMVAGDHTAIACEIAAVLVALAVAEMELASEPTTTRGKRAPVETSQSVHASA